LIGADLFCEPSRLTSCNKLSKVKQ